MLEINEPQFTANVKSWIDAICARFISADPEFPFLGAEVEVRKQGKLERRDLVLRPRNNPNGFALTGEVKLPDKPDGRSPYNESLVLDAHEKASAVGVEYFFTWNVNRFVLWQTFKPQTVIFDRQLNFYDWAQITDSSELARSEATESLKRRWEEFLLEFAAIYRGAKPFVRRPLDQWFIHLLESALDQPTVFTYAAFHQLYGTSRDFHRKLDDWMIRNLGATIRAEDEQDNLQRAARYSCYVMTNRIVFYDALRRKYPERLEPLAIPKRLKSSVELRERLEAAFQRAVTVTDDYETVFRGDEFGEHLPFLSNPSVEAWAVDAWRGLIEQVDKYDFTRLDYDIIGQIFDGLISPQERHRYGQHYTKSEIVDLINAFTIRDADATVLDPACGGGTFLIRAYARKKFLAARQGKIPEHSALLSGVYGVDLSAYAVHLSTISLAARDLVRASNYPRVACADFFDIGRNGKRFPAGVSARDDKVEFVGLPPLDAVVGNPPYIRHEKLTQDQKRRYGELARRSRPSMQIAGRSDIHIYFWPYAASFLKPDGRFGFLTSSSWLDVEYGFPLQRWILENFAIIAVMESNVEPWFTDARIATTVTILRREEDMRKRLDNVVRFVQIRRPLDDILTGHQRGQGDNARLEAAEQVRDFLESIKQDIEDPNWRVRVVRQSALISRLSLAGGEDDEEEEREQTPAAPNSTAVGGDPASAHTGGKWGIHLRAPDFFFELMKLCGDRFVPLGEIAEIRRGITSGCDAFFFPRDVTEERLAELGPKKFREVYGLTPKQSEKIRVCLAGDGSVHFIEAEFLEPEVHSLMEIDAIRMDPALLKRKILLVKTPKSKLRGKRVSRYISWGEDQNINSGTTCASRGRSRNWYDLNPNPRSDMFWPMTQKYRHIIAENQHHLVCNHRLFDIYAREGTNKDILCAVLNSSLVLFVKNFYGRWAGTEGTLDTEIIDVVRIPVPNTALFKTEHIKEIKKAFQPLRSRAIGYIRDEIKMEDRRLLDLSILEALGLSKRQARSLLEHLYKTIDQMYASYREIELKANANRARAARRGKNTPQSIGAEIWESLLKEKGSDLRPFPGDFLPDLESERSDRFEIAEGKARLLEMFGSYGVENGGKMVELGEENRARLLLAVASEGYEGPIALPKSAKTASAILNDWRTYKEEQNRRFEELAEQRTADPSMHERLVADLWRRYRRWSQERDEARL